MENKIYLQAAINKHCYLTGESESETKRKVKNGLWPKAHRSNQTQRYLAIKNNDRKYLKPYEYNWLCDNLIGCTSDLLNGRSKV